MESLDNILERLEPQLEPRRPLAGPVLARIAARRRQAQRLRLGMLAALVVSLAATLLTLVRGQALPVLRLALTHQAAVADHLSLYLRAVWEAVPVVPIMTLLAGLAMVWFLRRLEHRAARVAPWLAAGGFGLAVVSASAGAYAATTASPEVGPAQQEFIQVISKIGVPSVTIDGKTYPLLSGGAYTNKQLAAAVENFRLRQAVSKLDQSKNSLDGGNDGCLCRVLAMSPTSIELNYWVQTPGAGNYEPGRLSIDSQTQFFADGQPSAPFVLQPGDLVTAAPRSDRTSAAYIARTSFTFEELTNTALVLDTLPKHNDNGKCYNYEAALCPDVSTAVRQVYSYLPAESDVPAGAQIREVFGIVQSTSGSQRFTLKDSTGSIWNVVLGSAFGNSVMPGDAVRIEFWQLKDKAADRTIVDESGYTTEQFGGNLTKDEAKRLIAEGKLNPNPSNQIRGLQVLPPR